MSLGPTTAPRYTTGSINRSRITSHSREREVVRTRYLFFRITKYCWRPSRPRQIRCNFRAAFSRSF